MFETIQKIFLNLQPKFEINFKTAYSVKLINICSSIIIIFYYYYLIRINIFCITALVFIFILKNRLKHFFLMSSTLQIA